MAGQPVVVPAEASEQAVVGILGSSLVAERLAEVLAALAELARRVQEPQMSRRVSQEWWDQQAGAEGETERWRMPIEVPVAAARLPLPGRS